MNAEATSAETMDARPPHRCRPPLARLASSIFPDQNLLQGLLRLQVGRASIEVQDLDLHIGTSMPNHAPTHRRTHGRTQARWSPIAPPHRERPMAGPWHAEERGDT